MKQGVNSILGEAYRKDRSVIRNKDDVGGRAGVKRDEQQVLQRD